MDFFRYLVSAERVLEDQKAVSHTAVVADGVGLKGGGGVRSAIDLEVSYCDWKSGGVSWDSTLSEVDLGHPVVVTHDSLDGLPDISSQKFESSAILVEVLKFVPWLE